MRNGRSGSRGCGGPAAGAAGVSEPRGRPDTAPSGLRCGQGLGPAGSGGSGSPAGGGAAVLGPRQGRGLPRGSRPVPAVAERGGGEARPCCLRSAGQGCGNVLGLLCFSVHIGIRGGFGSCVWPALLCTCGALLHLFLPKFLRRVGRGLEVCARTKRWIDR